MRDPCVCTANVVLSHMGFSEAKRAVVAVLREGNFLETDGDDGKAMFISVHRTGS